MDFGDFDALSRSVASGAEPRRAVVRLLLGGALGVLTTRFGLVEAAEGKAKTKAKATRKKKSSPGEQPARGPLQAEGKRKGKGKGKGKKRRPPLPPGCQHCNACQMCQDGACVPDPALGGVPCGAGGPTCSHCLIGACVVTEQRPCDEGFCVRRGQCCPGEKYCTDPESSAGFACVGESDCCPGQRKCSDGACGTNTRCCPNEWKCADGTCVAQSQCCLNERKCSDGSCVSSGACCGEEIICNGQCVDQNRDPRNCGGCGRQCPSSAPACEQGECQVSCSGTNDHVCPPTAEYPQAVCCTPPPGLPCVNFEGCAGCSGHDRCCNWRIC